MKNSRKYVFITLAIVLAIIIIGLIYSKKDDMNNQENNNVTTVEEMTDENNVVQNNEMETENVTNEQPVNENAQQDNKENSVEEKSEENKNLSLSPNKTTTKTEKKDKKENSVELGKDDIFADYYKKADQQLKNMTLEEKVGQMFLARFPTSGVIEEIKDYNPGGYILFSRDFKDQTKSSMLDKLQKCQKASKIKLILGVDEEGGTVVRVSSNKNFRSSKFLSPQQLWKKGGLSAILKDSTEKTKLLRSIGLNMNLAPVADLPTKSSSFIYDRSYGKGVKETSAYVAELVKRMNNDGMISVMKHFPGYGDNVDTHTGVAIDNRQYNAFKKSDFLPFESGIQAGALCILVNHNIVKSMDASKPASLSKKVHDILRNDLNFTGIIITDDLAMDAVKKYAENDEAATQAVLAGNDVIISSDFKKQKEEVLRAVKDGTISEKQINTAVKRILAWKYKYGII